MSTDTTTSTTEAPRSLGALVLLAALLVPGAIELTLRASGGADAPSEHWTRRLALATYAPLTERLLRRGTLEVREGRGGWLFHRDALRYLRGDHREDPDRAVAAMLDFHRQLTERGVELVLLPVPAKVTVHPERLHRGTSDRTSNWPGWASFIAELEQRGVRIVDPAPPLRALAAERPAYLAHDTHWSPEGATAVAIHLAAALRQGPTASLLPTPRVFDHRAVEVDVRGDLATLLPGETPRPPQTVHVRQVISTEDGSVPIDRSSPLLLLGDSFTLAYSDPRLGLGQRAGLAEQLADALGAPVDVIAIPGGSSTQVRRTLAAREGGVTGKRLVIWQIAQRDVLRARDGWHEVALPAPGRSDRQPTRTDGAGPIDVRATSVGHALPADLDYADCLALLPFRLDEDVPPNTAGDTITVALWGWRDHLAEPMLEAFREPAAASRILTLTPLEPVVDLESTCWMGALDGEPWWLARLDGQPLLGAR